MLVGSMLLVWQPSGTPSSPDVSGFLLRTGATSREGNVYPSRANEFTPHVSGFVLLLRVPLVEKELFTHPEHPSSL